VAALPDTLERKPDPPALLERSRQGGGGEVELLAALHFVHRVANALGGERARSVAARGEDGHLRLEAASQCFQGARRHACWFLGSHGIRNRGAYSVARAGALSNFLGRGPVRIVGFEMFVTGPAAPPQGQFPKRRPESFPKKIRSAKSNSASQSSSSCPCSPARQWIACRSGTPSSSKTRCAASYVLRVPTGFAITSSQPWELNSARGAMSALAV